MIPRYAKPRVDYILDADNYGHLGTASNRGKYNAVGSNTPGTFPTIIHSGKYGRGLVFPDAVDQYAEYAYPFLHRTGDPFTALTVGGFFYADVTDGDKAIMGQDSGTVGNSTWRVEYDANAGLTEFTARMYSWDGTAVTTVTDGVIVNTESVSLVHGRTVYVIFIFYLDGSNNLNHEIYIDGALNATGAHTGGAGWNAQAPSSNVTVVGTRGQNYTQPFEGNMHGLFADRTRWSAARVKRAYANHWNELYEPQRLYVPMIDAPIVSIEEGPGTTVIITDVNGTETWVDGATGLVITGSGFA